MKKATKQGTVLFISAAMTAGAFSPALVMAEGTNLK